jgi:hypothetical protein
VHEQENDAPPSSQPRNSSASASEDEQELEQVVEKNCVPGFKAGEVIEISSDEEEENESEAEEESEDDQGNNPRANKEVLEEQYNRIEAEEEIQNNEGEVGLGVEDEFEGFDIKPGEKEFFKDLLHTVPPEAIKDLMGKIRPISPQFAWKIATESQLTKHAKIFGEVESLSDIAPDTQRTKRVKVFAEGHPFRELKKWTDEELQEYKDDVREFAKAAGLSYLQANVEVGKAVGAWKIEKCITLPSQLSMEATNNETKSDGEESMKEFKRRRKAEKKARRRLVRIEKQSSRSTSSARSESKALTSQELLNLGYLKFQPSQTSCIKHGTAASNPKTATQDSLSLPTTDEKSIGLTLKEKRRSKVDKKKLRKKAKLGPKKSGYFPTAPKDGMVPPRPKNAEPPKIQASFHEETRELKKVKLQLAKAADGEHGAHLDGLKQMAQEAKKAVKKAPLFVKEVSVDQKTQKDTSKTSSEILPVQKKKKNRNHKRHRNRNRLADEHDSMAIEDKASGLPPTKRFQGRSQMSNVAGDAEREAKPDFVSFKTSIVGPAKNSQQLFFQSAPDAADDVGRPSKRRDRGRGRKPRTKNEDLEMSNNGQSAVAEPAISASDDLFGFIETNELSSQKKRKRNKSKGAEGNVPVEKVEEAAAIEPLAELHDTNAKLERRIRYAEARAMSADAREVQAHPSAQSSKVRHSQ